MTLIEDYDNYSSHLGGKLITVGRNKYLVEDNLIELEKAIRAKKNILPEYIGELIISQDKKGEETPTLILMDKLSKIPRNKIYVTDEAEWLFLCGKDIFTNSVKQVVQNGKKDKIENCERGTEIFVYNSKAECIGYGRVINQGLVFLRNLMDKGDYLRREMDGRKKER